MNFRNQRVCSSLFLQMHFTFNTSCNHKSLFYERSEIYIIFMYSQSFTNVLPNLGKQSFKRYCVWIVLLRILIFLMFSQNFNNLLPNSSVETDNVKKMWGFWRMNLKKGILQRALAYQVWLCCKKSYIAFLSWKQ